MVKEEVKHYITIKTYQRSSDYKSKRATTTEQTQVYLPLVVVEMLDNPKELVFLLNSKGEPSLKFSTIDSRIRYKLIDHRGGGARLAVKVVEDHIVGRYSIEREGDDIYLTKIES